MPTISEFFGILIKMFFDDHNPPHFHAKYGGYEAEIIIKTGEIKEGKLPKTAARLVEEWRKLHADELLANWEKAKNLQLPDNIEPLE
jgi:hypothetical protein